jgi:hypothetical protein
MIQLGAWRQDLGLEAPLADSVHTWSERIIVSVQFEFSSLPASVEIVVDYPLAPSSVLDRITGFIIYSCGSFSFLLCRSIDP